MLKRAGRGFTLVELIVVVVVIAVLAFMTVASFSSMQTRAKNAQILSSVAQLKKLISSYQAIYRTAPSVVTDLCLTRNNVCTGSSGSPVSASNTALISELAKVGAVPESAPFSSGIRYAYNAAATVDGQSSPILIAFYLRGSGQVCGQGVVTGSGSTYVTSTSGYSTTNSTITLCYVPV